MHHSPITPAEAACVFREYAQFMEHWLGPPPPQHWTCSQCLNDENTPLTRSCEICGAPRSPEHRSGALPAQAKVLEIAYEELCTRPAEVARELCDHANLPWNERVANCWDLEGQSGGLPVAVSAAFGGASDSPPGGAPVPNAIGRAAAYAVQLAPVREALGPFAEPRPRTLGILKTILGERETQARKNLAHAVASANQALIWPALERMEALGLGDDIQSVQARAFELDLRINNVSAKGFQRASRNSRMSRGSRG